MTFEPALWVAEVKTEIEMRLHNAKTYGIIEDFVVHYGDPDRGPDIEIVYRPRLNQASIEFTVVCGTSG